MATINQVIRERKKVFIGLKKALKQADTVLETMERRQNSILSRKLKVPELQDLAFLAGRLRDLDRELRQYGLQVNRGFPI
jgi:hypothetical protein